MTTYYEYRIYCNTEAADQTWILSENDPVPSTCPNNTAHSVDTSTITITKTLSEHIVKIQEEVIPTGGNFRAESHSLICATGPDVESEITLQWPYPVNVLGLTFISTEENTGDSVQLVLGENTTVGVITADVATGATGAYLSQTAIDNLMVGYKMNITDGIGLSDCGIVLKVDKTTNHVNFTEPTNQSFSYLSPTFVRMSVYSIDNYVIGPPGMREIGKNKIGGSYLPAGVLIKGKYLNKSDYAKSITTQIEFLY